MEMEMQNVFPEACVGDLMATWMHFGQFWVSGG